MNRTISISSIFYFCLILLFFNNCSSGSQQENKDQLSKKELKDEKIIKTKSSKNQNIDIKFNKESQEIDKLKKALDYQKKRSQDFLSLIKFYEDDLKDLVVHKIYDIKSDRKVKVKLYYLNDLKYQKYENDSLSKSITYIEKEIPKTDNIIENTIRLRLANRLSEKEKSKGLTGEFPITFFLKNVELSNNVLKLDFNDLEYFSHGGSTRVGILEMQIEKTAMQFPEVDEVSFPEEVFQP